MKRTLAVSVLDLIEKRPEETEAAALARSLDLARHAELWGYRRFWIAEHHATIGMLCSATPILISYIAANTRSIRVGSGGVMLPNHAPLIVAEQFGTLDVLYPSRIDLGLGRARGTKVVAAQAIRKISDQTKEDFPALLRELRTYLAPMDHGREVFANPGQGSNIPIILLGSTIFSAQLAGELGFPFAFAAHFAADRLHEAARVYHSTFRCAGGVEKPYLMISLEILIANTDRHARDLFTTQQERLQHSYPPLSETARSVREELMQSAVIGSPNTVRDRLETVLQEVKADEVIALTETIKASDRLHSYESLARIASEIEI